MGILRKLKNTTENLNALRAELLAHRLFLACAHYADSVQGFVVRILSTMLLSLQKLQFGIV